MNLPTLIAGRILAADDALPAFEMSGTAEPCEANVNLELQTAQDQARYFIADGTSETGTEPVGVVPPCSKVARALVVCNTV